MENIQTKPWLTSKNTITTSLKNLYRDRWIRRFFEVRSNVSGLKRTKPDKDFNWAMKRWISALSCAKDSLRERVLESEKTLVRQLDRYRDMRLHFFYPRFRSFGFVAPRSSVSLMPRKGNASLRKDTLFSKTTPKRSSGTLFVPCSWTLRIYGK